MNIQTAAHYLSSGYRIRRPSWHQSDYVYLKDDALYSREHEHHGHSVGFFYAGLEELLADDWEIITAGVVSYFPIKYEDEQ
jgi:hypothetical protein